MDLDLKIIRTCPIRMSACGTLVDAFRQVSHVGDTLGNLLAKQHSTAARLGTLSDHDLDRICPAQIVGVHAVA